MKKLKNRKHLTAAAILLMLTFLAGAAFAITPGAIQAVGVVGVTADILRVEWTEADENAVPLIAIVNEADITTGLNMGGPLSTPPYYNQPRMGPWTANHRIEWLLGFIDDGIVILDVEATNTGTIDARVYAPGAGPINPALPNFPTPLTGTGAITWNDPTPAFSTDHLTVTVTNPTGGTFTGPLTWPVVLEPGETVEAQIIVEMEDFEDLLVLLGLAPLGWGAAGGWPELTGPTSPFGDGNPLEDFEWVNSFVFSLTYVAD